MSLYTILIALVVVGVILYLVSIAPFIKASWKPIIYWIVGGIVIIWLLNSFGFFEILKGIHT